MEAVDLKYLKEKQGKRYSAAVGKLRQLSPDPLKGTSYKKALEYVCELPKTKFDQTVNVAIRLNVDPKQADQMVRGAVTLRTLSVPMIWLRKSMAVGQIFRRLSQLPT